MKVFEFAFIGYPVTDIAFCHGFMRFSGKKVDSAESHANMTAVTLKGGFPAVSSKQPRVAVDAAVPNIVRD
jgi:hypothetical protein